MIKEFQALRERWKAKTPVLFSKIIKVAMTLSGTAIAIQAAYISNSVEIPEWWSTLCPYIIAFGLGASAVAKVTQQYDDEGNPVKKDKKDEA